MGNRITRVSLVASIGGYVSDVRKGKQETGDLRREAERFSKGRYDAKIGADTKAARTELSALEKRLQAFGRTAVDGRVNLDTDEAKDRLRNLQGQMTEFATRVSDARVDLDDAEAQAKISRIEAALLRLGRMSADPDIDLGGIASAEADLATLTRQLDAFDGNDYRAQVHVDGTLAATRQASALIDTLAMLGPTVVPLTAAAAPVLAGLTGGLAAAATGAGVTALAFSGVGDALDAMNDRQIAAGANAQASAQAQVAASQQIADARRGVAEAERAAVEAATDAADQVADARRGVVDAERDAARAAREGARDIAEAQERVGDARREAAEVARDAAQAVEDAEERLADSHRRVEDAQRSLNDARQQAIRDLQELRERTEDNVLDVEGAEIRLLRARERLAEVSANEAADELDLREARLRVAEAEDRLADAKRQTAVDQRALTKAEADGVRGAAGVVEAREQVAEAQRGVRDTQEGVADAQRDAARAQRDAAEQVQDAIAGVANARREAAERNADAARSVAAAERDLARAQQDAARSRADAARRIEDAQRTLQRAIASASTAMGEQSTEAEKLREKMAALGPAGRDFVRYLQSIRPELQRLQDIAQAGMFPGMQDGLESLMTLMPRAERLVDNVSTAIGTLAREGGEALTDPFWREFFDYIDDEAADVLLDFTRGTGNVIEGLAGMSMALDPLSDDFREFFLENSEDFATWGTTLSENEGYKDFVAYVRRVSPEVWDTLGEVAETMLAIAEAAAPVGEVSLPIIRGLANVLEVIAESPAGPVLIGTAAGMAAINRTIRVYDAAKHSRMVGLIGSMGGRAEASQGKLGRFGRFLGAAGPWGAAVGIGVAVLAGWAASQDEAEARVREHTDALDEQTGALTELNVEKVVAMAREEGWADSAKELGIGLGLLTKALLGDEEAIAAVNGRLRDAKQFTNEADRENRNSIVGLNQSQRAANQLSEAINGQNAELRKAQREFREEKLMVDAGTRALEGMNDKTNAASVRQRALAGDTDLTRRELLDLAAQLGLNRRETQELIEKYRDVPKNVDTDANFKDKDARRKAREFKRYVKDQLRDIKDEKVTVGLFMRQFGAEGAHQLKLKGQSYNFGGPNLTPHTAAAAPAKAMRGAMGGANLIPRAKVDRESVATATDAVSEHRRDLAEKIQDLFDKLTPFDGGSVGAPGRVLPKGRYSIGMPYLGYAGHYGADYPAATGTPVYSPWPGRVTASYDIPGSNAYNSTPYASYGRVVKIDHPNGYSTLYAHLSERIGSTGPVAAGQQIGSVGMNGNATGPHLHFEARRGGGTINPASLGLFDRGGVWPSGTMGVNLSGKPELVLTNDQAKALFPNFDRSGGRDLTPDYSSWARVTPAAPSSPAAGTARVVEPHFHNHYPAGADGAAVVAAGVDRAVAQLTAMGV